MRATLAVVVILEGERVVLRPAEAQDVGRLTSILAEPAVAGRWGRFDDADGLEEFVGDDKSFVIAFDREVIGVVQYHEEKEPMYRHAGIDIFLTTARHRQGLGTDAIRTLARHLFDELGHHRLVIDPAADNEAAIRAYEAVGFRTVGIMRAYERGPDGSWHDGMLMDMLAGELVERGAASVTGTWDSVGSSDTGSAEDAIAGAPLRSCDVSRDFVPPV